MLAPLRLDLFVAPSCRRCHGLEERVAAVAREFAPGAVELRVVDLAVELAYAVDLGVRSFPALAVNGTLAFPSIRRGRPFDDALRRTLARALTGRTGTRPDARMER